MSEEINVEVIKKTQKLLGKYVKKPPLTEKLLKKPPFRFLHDIVKAVIKETGFLKGLFSDFELNSDNVKEKDAKIAFLTKLIDAVKTITKTDLTVKPNKIVAGLEPAATNLLLQNLGKALDKKLDSREYVQQYNSGILSSNNKKEDKPKKNVTERGVAVKKGSKSINDKEGNAAKTKTLVKKKSPSSETPKSTDRSKSKVSPKENKHKNKEDLVNNKEKPKEAKPKVSKIVEEPTNNSLEIVNDVDIESKANNSSRLESENIQSESVQINNEMKGDVAGNNNKDNLIEKDIITNNDNEKSIPESVTQLVTEKVKPEPEQRERVSSAMVRPKSARPKSGDREKHISSSMKETEKDDQNTEVEKKPFEMNSAPHQPTTRPKSSLRPPSVRPSSARPGAPRLRPDSALPIQEPIIMGSINVIVESVDNVDDEETVVIQSTAEDVEEGNSSLPDLKIPQDNKGHLVEQILEQIQEGEGDEGRKRVDIDWEQDNLQGKDATSREINNLRALIQTLTKTANPLGKLLNYLHEDIDAMHSELQMWTNTKKQLFLEISKQKKMGVESNKPLHAQLDHIQQEIKKQEQEIVNVRSNILRNETRIKELLTK